MKTCFSRMVIIIPLLLFLFSSCTKTTKFHMGIKEGDLLEYTVNIQSSNLKTQYTVTYETYIMHETEDKYYVINKIKDIVQNTKNVNNYFTTYEIPTITEKSRQTYYADKVFINYRLLESFPSKYLDTEVLLEINKNGEIKDANCSVDKNNMWMLRMINIISLLRFEVNDFNLGIPFSLSYTQNISIDGEVPLTFTSAGILKLSLDNLSNPIQVKLGTVILIKKKTTIFTFDPDFDLEKKKTMYAINKFSDTWSFIESSLSKEDKRNEGNNIRNDVDREIEFKLRLSNYFRSFKAKDVLDGNLQFIKEYSLASSFYDEAYNKDFEIINPHITYSSKNSVDVQLEQLQSGSYSDFGVVGAYEVKSYNPDGSDFDSLALESLNFSNYSVKDVFSIFNSDIYNSISFTSKVRTVISLSKKDHLWYIYEIKNETVSTKIDSIN